MMQFMENVMGERLKLGQPAPDLASTKSKARVAAAPVRSAR